jgi:hypothetical protein
LLATLIRSVVVGDANDLGLEHNLNLLRAAFHPDAAQRQDAHQKLLDDIEFKFETEIRQLERAGDVESARLLRENARQHRAMIEAQVGKKLLRRKTIESEADDDTSLTHSP